MPTLLDHLRDHLISESIVRSPRTAGAAPPLWLEPREGIPAPGEGSGSEVGADAVLGAYFTGGIASQPWESFIREDTIDLWLRTRTAPIAFTLWQQLREELIDKRNWNMAGLTIIESREWRPLQPLYRDAQAFTFVASIVFERYAADAP
jgi:hypothetical protein